MLNFDKALDLPPQLQWKYANEPELMEWTIRARNYNTFAANSIFYFMAALILGGSFIMYSVYEGMSQPWRTLSCIFFFIFILFTISCMNIMALFSLASSSTVVVTVLSSTLRLVTISMSSGNILMKVLDCNC